MKIEIGSWNDGAGTFNALAQETGSIWFQLDHKFKEPATCTIEISDPTGSKAAAYNTAANAVFIGPAKVELEHPTTIDLFLGRLLEVRADSKTGKTTLYCEDWLNQLKDEKINYDMREDLNGSGLRQSVVKSDVGDETTPVSQTVIYAKADDGGAFTDESTEVNERTADDLTLLPAVPVVNDAYYLGIDALPDTTQLHLSIEISTAGVGVWEIIWEYYDNIEEAWYAFDNVTDGTNGFTVAGTSLVTMDIPTGPTFMTQVEIDGTTKYWARARVSSYTSITTQPLGTQAWIPQKLYDDDMSFDVGEWDGMYLIFPAEAAGTRTIITGPYADTVAGTETAGSYASVWLDDANFHDLTRNGSTLTVDYDFHINAEFGSLYSSGPSEGKIYLTCISYNDLQAANMKVKIKTAAEVYKTVQTIAISTTTTDIKRFTITIPTQYLTAFVDTLGEVTIQLEVEGGPGQIVYLDVYQCLMSLTYVLTGTSEAFLITDTANTNEIHTVANLSYNGLGIYEGCPYSVAKPIYKHIDTAESVGLSLVSDEGGDESGTGPDPLIEITAAATVEHTTGITTRNYQGRTRLEILQDLSDIDQAVFWVTLGTSTLTYKKTFNEVAPTALNDSIALAWHSKRVFNIFNEYDVYGVRIGDSQLHTNTGDLATDPGADSKSTYGVTRSEVVRATGALSQYETEQLGTALVEKNEDVLLLLSAELAGLDSTYRLGTEVSITSTYLNLNAQNYVVVNWAYDSRTNKSTIILHPRVSIGYQEVLREDNPQKIMKDIVKAKIDTYTPSLYTQEW